MKIIFLGTNGWYTTPTGNTPSVLIDSKTHYVIFDAGNGIYKLNEYIKEQKPIALFISHFHIDHISGLHTLNKFTFSQGIDIYVGPNRKKDFETLVHPPFTIGSVPSEENIYNLNFDVRVHELEDGKNDIGFPAEVFKLYHAYIDHGFKVTLEGKTIAYSGDTGIGENNVPFAKNADVLIHECSWKEVMTGNVWGHVNAEMAAQLAKDANVKKLVLNHFDASVFTKIEERKEAEEKAKKIFPNTTAAVDDWILEI